MCCCYCYACSKYATIGLNFGRRIGRRFFRVRRSNTTDHNQSNETEMKTISQPTKIIKTENQNQSQETEIKTISQPIKTIKKEQL